MATGSLTRSDLHQLYNVVQNTQEAVFKDIFIGLIKDAYKKDSYYHYVEDEFGFAKIVDLKGIPLEGGISDQQTTRIFIGEKFKRTAVFYPQILVATGGAKDFPVSFNMERGTVKNEAIRIVDGYGNEKDYIIPSAFIFAGAWEGSVTFDITTRDILSRDEITSFLMLFIRNIAYPDLLKAGITVKSVSSSGPSEDKDRQQEPLYKKTVTAEVRGEWRREIPVMNILDVISICIEIGNTATGVFAPNLEINTRITLDEAIAAL